MKTVTYLSDFAKEYSLGLRQCKTLERLREFTLHWVGFAPDAFERVRRMNDEDWTGFQKGLRSESRGKYAGDAWNESYADVIMPALLFRVSMIASHFNAPWGVAFKQCEAAGIIQQRGDAYVWVQPEKGDEVNELFTAIDLELSRARDGHAPLNSAHEAYAVILEELDEFKAEVWKKTRERDQAAMRAELIQLAAMAIRAIEDLRL